MNGYLDIATMEQVFKFFVKKLPEKNWGRVSLLMECLDEETRQATLGFLQEKLAEKQAALNRMQPWRERVSADGTRVESWITERLAHLEQEQLVIEKELKLCQTLLGQSES
jgi:hypothetical protein